MQQQTQDALYNILLAYTIRNPTIGYCQGFNFFVGRILEAFSTPHYLAQEETFWVMCQIVETLLPLDYYANLVGALIDQKVFESLLQ